MYSRSLHWFRRDLRISDNPALNKASTLSKEVLPVYVISDWTGGHLWTGPPRQEFLCGCLASLGRNLETIGGRLIYRRGNAMEELLELLHESGAEAIFFNRDPDPFGREAEQRLAALCERHNIACHSCKDAVLHEPDEVLKNDGSPYRVYTPYSRRWLALPKDSPAGKPHSLTTPAGVASLPPPTLETWGLSSRETRSLPPGERAARDRLEQACANRLPSYAAHRDCPAAQSTSRLSQDLRFGTISIREVFRKSQLPLTRSPSPPHREDLEKFAKELAWREFYMQILAHFPEVLELEFQPDYRGLPWAEPGESWDCWKSGRTGFPIVDAGMRELAATGFMHNRVRMIVAMFLTKDLHLDWRLGEQFFMQSLVDGEIASNNGGWQWSAGTGADAAPYFRIQNPWTQSKRYDSDGRYIRKWIPELADTPPKALHSPPPAGQSVAPGYPSPIVDHAEERKRTLALFKHHLAMRNR